jgi:hypothetical protein
MTYATYMVVAPMHQVFLDRQWNRFRPAEVAVTNKELGLATFGMLVASSMSLMLESWATNRQWHALHTAINGSPGALVSQPKIN